MFCDPKKKKKKLPPTTTTTTTTWILSARVKSESILCCIHSLWWLDYLNFEYLSYISPHERRLLCHQETKEYFKCTFRQSVEVQSPRRNRKETRDDLISQARTSMTDWSEAFKLKIFMCLWNYEVLAGPRIHHKIGTCSQTGPELLNAMTHYSEGSNIWVCWSFYTYSEACKSHQVRNFLYIRVYNFE